jgi:nucleoside phosphorylase/tetratricopeptide (TPR) repeat protein
LNQFVYERRQVEAFLTEETEAIGNRTFQESATHYKANVDDTVTSQETVGFEDRVGPPRATAVILTALDVEYEAARSRLDSTQLLRLEGGTRYEVGRFEGTHLNWEVAVAEIGEGNVGAAIGTVRAIEHFNPDLVLFIGVAGGLKEGMRHGEVVVASKVYGYHGGKAQSELYSRPLAFPITHTLEQAVREARRGKWFGGDASDSLSEQPPVQLKPIAAGEIVIASTDSDVYRYLKQHYNDAVAVDMESAGMYEAALRYEGLPALAIRGISDLLEDKSPEADADLQPMAANHAAAFAFALLGVIHPGDLRPRPAAPSPTSVTDVGKLLTRVPPKVAGELERARLDTPEVADRLLTRLADGAASPTDLVTSLWAERPYWLTACASPRIWAAIGEFAASHKARVPAIDAFKRAAELGGQDAPRWMARAALAAAGDDQLGTAQMYLQQARQLAGGAHTFADVIEAAIAVDTGGDPSAVVDAAQAHTGDDDIVDMLEGLALLRMGRKEEALAVFEAAFENNSANATAAVQVAEVFLKRYVADESDSPIDDLERAREFSLQARDLRRSWRGDSAEAVVLAAQAAYFAGDLKGVLRIALPQPEGEATETEAARDEVRKFAAYAALDSGNPQLGLDLAENMSNPLEKDLIQAACFKAMPGSEDLAKEAYWRALATARGSQKRIRAYFGLAELGEWPLPDLEDVAEHDREVHDLIVAKSELVRGDFEEAIRRYRTWARRGSSRALDALVDAYVQNDRVDEAVIALRDGAVRLNNPELRYRAAHTLDLNRRPAEAEAEARHAMDVAPAGSSTHRELRKLRIELAAKLDDWNGVAEQARAALREGIDLPGYGGLSYSRSTTRVSPTLH